TLANNVTVIATRDVILESGSAAGVRIGTGQAASPADGTISITTQTGSIQLNGTTQPTAIRTAGNVTLNAATTINEEAQGFVEAAKLTRQSGGDAKLGGNNKVAKLSAPNRFLFNPPPAPPTVLPGVGGALTFNNTSSLKVEDSVSSGT